MSERISSMDDNPDSVLFVLIDDAQKAMAASLAAHEESHKHFVEFSVDDIKAGRQQSQEYGVAANVMNIADYRCRAALMAAFECSACSVAAIKAKLDLQMEFLRDFEPYDTETYWHMHDDGWLKQLALDVEDAARAEARP